MMPRKNKTMTVTRGEVKGIYLMTVAEGLYVQFLLFCVIQMVDMTTLPPVFNPTDQNVTAHVGETATLKCSISHLGSRQVIWKKVGEKHALTVGEFVFVKDASFAVKHIPYLDEWNLMINDVQTKHSGKYECQVSTKENMYRYVYLTVSDKRKRIKNEPSRNLPEVHITGPKFVEKSHPIHLTCNATGSTQAPEEIDWFQQGRKIKSDPMKEIFISKYIRQETKTLYSELTIRHSDQMDSGIYICRSSDNKLTEHRLMVLNAKSTPGKRESNSEQTDNSSLNIGPLNKGNSQRRKRLVHWIDVCLLPILLVIFI